MQSKRAKPKSQRQQQNNNKQRPPLFRQADFSLYTLKWAVPPLKVRTPLPFPLPQIRDYNIPLCTSHQQAEQTRQTMQHKLRSET